MWTQWLVVRNNAKLLDSSISSKLFFLYTRNWENQQLVPGWLVDINRREQGCAAHYEQYCQHVVTALFNCNNLEQHG
jgi:hypothetical protein